MHLSDISIDLSHLPGRRGADEPRLLLLLLLPPSVSLRCPPACPPADCVIFVPLPWPDQLATLPNARLLYRRRNHGASSHDFVSHPLETMSPPSPFLFFSRVFGTASHCSVAAWLFMPAGDSKPFLYSRRLLDSVAVSADAFCLFYLTAVISAAISHHLPLYQTALRVLSYRRCN